MLLAGRKLAWLPPMLRLSVLGAALAGSAALAGCAAYQPNSFSDGPRPVDAFAGQHATVGCLDVAVARRPDYGPSAVLQYQFGNRCNRAVTVDLQRLTVVGRHADGSETTLAPYDPEQELHPALLAGRLSGREALAYPSQRAVSQICVDVSTIVSGAARPPQWLCFATQAEEDDEADSGVAAATTPEVTP
jgi:hypothetical protein